MALSNCLCLSIDRLHSGLIGAYGNSWIHTRHIDHLACQSFVFDQAYIDSTRLDVLYRSLWSGVHAARQTHAAGQHNLIAALATLGINTALVTDEAQLLDHPLAAAFQHKLFVKQPAANGLAETSADTELARLLTRAGDWIEAARRPFFLWVHARGMGGAWDAPFEYRAAYADEEDPTPPDLFEPPARRLPKKFDPDELLGVVHAYSGQVALLDECVGTLLARVEALGLGDELLTTFLAPRGFPLGEHHRIGAIDDALYGELTQMVWMMRFPGQVGKLARSQALAQPADFAGTLLDGLGVDRAALDLQSLGSLYPIVLGRQLALRDVAYTIGVGEQALRTPAWLLRQANDGPPELYAKPSDRFETNEVSRLCHEITDAMQAVLTSISSGGEVDALDDSLLVPVD